MSISKRKVGFYSLILKEKATDEVLDPYIFRPVLDYLNAKDKKQRVIENKRSNKFNLMYSMSDRKDIQNIVFGSAKYNHRPPIIDKDSAVERENPKSLSEGDLEKTHITLHYCEDEIILLLEERQVGISIGRLVHYFNAFAKKIHSEHDKKVDYCIEYAIIPKDDFLNELNQLYRVTAGTIFYEKQLLGSEYLNISKRLDTVQEDIEITVKAKKDLSIRKLLKDCYHSCIAEDSKITKIRVYGVTHENNRAILDTEIIKKIEYVETDLNEHTGLVDSHHIFRLFNDISQGLVP